MPTLTTEWLKWVTPRAGGTRTWSAPTMGEQVIVPRRRPDVRHHRAGAVLTGV
ncbi:phage baseplate assembly protein V [Janthinobacterium lividum]|uniref:phage baseplate assembly protein V n=1 Tax=Janthinobacterium lividum TaxID=29581 RepID=UPI001CB9B518